MSTWVIPYIDQTPAFWEELAEQFGAHIKEVYFPPPAGAFATGRSPQPAEHLEQFLRYAPLPKAVLLNPIVLPRPAREIAPAVLALLGQLYEMYGVSSVTVTDPTLACCIREAYPHFRIAASVLMRIARPAQLLAIEACVDAITPDNALVRDLAGLRQLRAAFSGEIRLLVNEACLPGCLYRTQHFYEMGYGDFFAQSLCQPLLRAHPWLRLTGAWILPRHLVYYDGLYDTLKLAGRVTLQDPRRYLTVLGAYIRREPILPCEIGGGPASLLEPIDIPDELFTYILHCDKNCHDCSVCRDYYDLATAGGGKP